MRGEDLEPEALEALDFGGDVRLAASRLQAGSNVYLVGPPGSGKTAMLRLLGIYMSRLGRSPLYVKLEWVKYGWGLADYLRAHGGRLREMGPHSEGPDLVLLDDGELLWRFGPAYRRLLAEVAGLQKAAAFREVDMDALPALLGDGLLLHLPARGSGGRAKVPFGLSFIGQSREVVVI